METINFNPNPAKLGPEYEGSMLSDHQAGTG